MENILHYTLGLPPYRSGGLTRYATDLMLEQVTKGYNVFLLYANAGIFSFQIKSFKYEKMFSGINVYRLNCKLPISLLHGIKSPKSFIKSAISEKEAESFLNQLNIKIIHIHTLMGLPIELLYAAKKLNIKIIYTTHDYFGLCLKVNFIDNSNCNCDKPSSEKCAKCNYNSPSNLLLKIRNNKSILSLKGIIKNKSFLYKINVNESIKESDFIIPQNTINQYEELLSFYKELYNLTDLFHFNSSISYSIYKKYLPNLKGDIIYITHKGIQDKRTIKRIKNNIKIGFIGSLDQYKGFPLLKKILIDLYKSNYVNWQLNVWGSIEGTDSECPLIRYKGTFNKENEHLVYSNIDLLIVPSLCKETFSLVTIEALSYGVPVIVSDNVGAKDIISKYDDYFIFRDEYEFHKILTNCLSDPKIIENYNQKIISQPFLFSMNNHTKEMLAFYGITNEKHK